MKYGIELNGVANIKILMEMFKANLNLPKDPESEQQLTSQISDQLDLLERYMLAYATNVSEGKKPPYWHEIRENRLSYPLNRNK